MKRQVRAFDPAGFTYNSVTNVKFYVVKSTIFSVLLLVSDCHVFQGSHILTDSLLILIVKEIDDISC